MSVRSAFERKRRLENFPFPRSGNEGGEGAGKEGVAKEMEGCMSKIGTTTSHKSFWAPRAKYGWTKPLSLRSLRSLLPRKKGQETLQFFVLGHIWTLGRHLALGATLFLCPTHPPTPLFPADFPLWRFRYLSWRGATGGREGRRRKLITRAYHVRIHTKQERERRRRKEGRKISEVLWKRNVKNTIQDKLPLNISFFLWWWCAGDGWKREEFSPPPKASWIDPIDRACLSSIQLLLLLLLLLLCRSLSRPKLEWKEGRKTDLFRPRYLTPPPSKDDVEGSTGSKHNRFFFLPVATNFFSREFFFLCPPDAGLC